jgi:hypothetical protein
MLLRVTYLMRAAICLPALQPQRDLAGRARVTRAPPEIATAQLEQLFRRKIF